MSGGVHWQSLNMSALMSQQPSCCRASISVGKLPVIVQRIQLYAPAARDVLDAPPEAQLNMIFLDLFQSICMLGHLDPCQLNVQHLGASETIKQKQSRFQSLTESYVGDASAGG